MNQKSQLSQSQQQRLRLSPQQVRFGRLLEMSAPEFEDEVKRMLEENPALEQAAQHDDRAIDQDDEGHDFNESAEDLQRADYSDPDDIPYYRVNINNHSADDPDYDFTPADDDISATQQLIEQLNEMSLSDIEREAATYVIGNLDTNGYLTRTPAQIADDMAMTAGIYVDRKTIDKAIEAVRTLDPAGICAYDLQDCLLLQLGRLEQTEAVINATSIIRDRFNLFSKKHFDKIRSAMSIDAATFGEALKTITDLNPKPGVLLESSGSSDRMRHIVPDFTIDISPEGMASVSLAGYIPELSISRTFDISTKKDGSEIDSAAATFIKDRRDEADEFIELTRRRSDTLMSVMEAIVRIQAEFFATADRSKLKPMVLRDIRSVTGLDLSTISRATNTKYALTPHGMVALRSLFSEGVAGSDGEDDTSTHAVTEAIKDIIKNEDHTRPLSDDAICKALKALGMDVARRTVAKYRERIGIPVARLRRK